MKRTDKNDLKLRTYLRSCFGKLSNYTLLHGYAISIGMVIANKIAIQKDCLSLQSQKE